MELRERRKRPFDLLYGRVGDSRFHAGCGGRAFRNRSELAILLRRDFRPSGFVFFPAVTELDAQGDQAGLRKLYLRSTKYIFLGSILLGSIAMFSAHNFFRLWVGSYAEPTGYPSVATIFYLLLVGSMIAVAQRIGYQVLLGVRRVKSLALLFAAEGVSNLLISLALVRSYGLLGVAPGTLIPAILFQGVLQPVCVCKSLQISLTSYCREVLLRPALVLGALVLVIARGNDRAFG